MMKRISLLRREEAGAATVEFAITALIMLGLTIAIIQIGIVWLASAGLRQGVESGARYATIYPTPTEAQIKSKVLSSAYGLDPSHITGPTVTYGTANGQTTAMITMGYQISVDLILIQPQVFTLSQSRTAYQVPVI